MQLIPQKIGAVTVVLMALAALPAAAGTISIDTYFMGVQVGYALDHPQGGNLFAPNGLGSVRMSNAQGISGFDVSGSFEAYCADILGDIFTPGTSTAFVPATVPASASPLSAWSDPHGIGVAGRGGQAAWLYDAFNPAIEGQPGSALLSFAALGLSATADAARTALAMSIWEVLYETAGAYGVSDNDGDFFVWCDTTSPAYNPAIGCGPHPQGTVVTLANAFLTTLGTQTGEATWLMLGTPGEDVQDFVGPAAAAPVPETPEPLIVVLTLTSVVWWARRRA